MTDETPIVMESYEYEMIKLFREINLNRPIALTLACLAKGREISGRKEIKGQGPTGKNVQAHGSIKPDYRQA